MGETAADEQDLAKALDSVADSMSAIGGTTTSSPAAARSDSSLSFEETTSSAASDISAPVVPVDSPVAPPVIAPLVTPVATDTSTVIEGPLADIKKDALEELRPLVDKLSVSPEEKFDTYLLLIRSTDDVDLIGPAHEAAKMIDDEPRRAEALLDIIKEIDYLSQNKKAA